MRLPWVSRERLEDAQREIAELKAERTVLYDRLAVIAGQQPLFAPAPAPAPAMTEGQREAAKDAGAEAKPMGKKLTRKELIDRAQAAVSDRKLGPVAVSSLPPMGVTRHG